MRRGHKKRPHIRYLLLRTPGPVFTKGLSQGLGLKLRLLSKVSAQKLLIKTFVLRFVAFTKNLRLVLGLAKGSTLRLVSSWLKFCKEDLNMAVHKLFSTSKFEMAVNKVLACSDVTST